MKKLFLLFFVFAAQNLLSQITVSPIVILVEPESRSAQVTLANRGIEAKQVEIYFKFGYAETDSSGSLSMQYGDTLPLAGNSLVPYIKVFPKKIILEPNKEQIVRFLLKGAGKLADGTYWTRVVFRSSPVLKPADTVHPRIDAQMLFVTESNTIIIYEKGRVNTGLELKAVKSAMDSANVTLNLDFGKYGNSPFWGAVTINVFDKDDDLVEVKSEPVYIYTDGIRSFRFDKKKFKSGAYNAEILINSDYPEIKDNYKIRIKPIESTFRFKIDSLIN